LPLAVAKTGWTASQPPEVRARMMGDSFVAHRIDPRPASRDTRSLRVHQSVTRVPRIATLNDHDEETTTLQTITGEAGLEKALAFGSAESRSDTGPLRLDHPHRARQLRPRSDEELVRQGSGLEVQAELPHAWRRIPSLCLLRQGRRRDSRHQAVRAARQQFLRLRRGHERRIRKGASRRSRGGRSAYAGHGGRDRRSSARTRRRPDRILGSVGRRAARRPVPYPHGRRQASASGPVASSDSLVSACLTHRAPAAAPSDHECRLCSPTARDHHHFAATAVARQSQGGHDHQHRPTSVQ